MKCARAGLLRLWPKVSTKKYIYMALQSRRNLMLSARLCGAYDAEFDAAKERLNTLTEDPGNQVKLKLYGLFKQATVGVCDAPKPGMMDFVGKAKWEAWNELGKLSQDDAQKHYIEVINKLAGAQSASSQETASQSEGKFQNITFRSEDSMSIITLNRPAKYNALTMETYNEIVEALAESAKNKNAITVLTGNGSYYCSGNDLGNFANITPGEIEAVAEKGRVILLNFVSAFIEHPKPIVALVNGPAIGISVTTLALCDTVYATEKATFQTPFSQIGQTPEGCSSLLFPRILGTALATEMLLFNRKLTAQEACQRGFIADVFPENTFQKEAWDRCRALAKLPPKTLQMSKALVRANDKEALHAINERECLRLKERWQSEECINAIMAFFQQKAKL